MGSSSAGESPFDRIDHLATLSSEPAQLTFARRLAGGARVAVRVREVVGSRPGADLIEPILGYCKFS